MRFMNIIKLREDFPLLERKINGKPIVYLDSAATSLKPRAVVEAMRKYYEEYTANIHRGVYRLSEEATAAYEGAREKVAKFIGAKTNEMVFVGNATEAINLVAYSWGEENIKEGDEIVLTVMEHHANLVPWQQLAIRKGARLKYVQLLENGLLDMDNFRQLLSERTRLVAVTQVSNVLGTVNPVKELINKFRVSGFEFRVLVDGAQAAGHMKVDVKELGCDWYVWSGHKMLGPTGIGVLWGREELLNEMRPWQFGGEMIMEVDWERSSFKETPYKFEAGTPAIAEAIGLGAAVDYLESLGMEKIREHEMGLVGYGLRALKSIKGLRAYGSEKVSDRGGVIAFSIEGIHPHDLAQVLDEDNVYIRAGHHCAMPLHKYLGLAATARVSFYVYNTTGEIELLVEGIEKAKRKLKK